MVSFLASSVGKWQLSRLFSKKERISEALNLSAMNTAILLFDIDTQKEYECIVSFVKRLKKEGLKSVEVVTYCSEKIVPAYIAQNEVRVITKSEVNLFGFPNEKWNTQVLANSYDLLIDCTQEIKMPTHYLLALIDAKTKVGKGGTENEYIFDLLIDQKELILEEYLKSVIHFLKMINKD